MTDDAVRDDEARRLVDEAPDSRTTRISNGAADASTSAGVNGTEHDAGPKHDGSDFAPPAVGDDHSNAEANQLYTTINSIVTQAQAGDVGAAFTSEAIDALRALNETDYPAFARTRADLKKARVQVGELDRRLCIDTDFSNEKTATDLLVTLADEQCSLFHDPDGEPYATLVTGGHREVHRISGKGFSEWLSHMFYRRSGRAPSQTALANARLTIGGKAKFDGVEAEVHIRVALHDRAYWIDLCDEQWRAVRVTAGGWKIMDEPPVYFVRSSSMRPLPTPTRGGDLTKLWAIVNVSEDDRLIALTWMLECFRPETPYPVIEFSGTQGTAKTTTQAFIREFIDPNKVNNRAAPKNVEDLYVAARNAHVVSIENLSYLSPSHQDALCQLATGGGYAARTLYTNEEESLLKAKKPVMLNGIAINVTAQDLCDRTVHLDLKEIEKERLTETEIAKRFTQDRNAIFGGLLDLFVRVLNALPAITTEGLKLPRMADFALLGEAVYCVHGEHDTGAFLRDYDERRRESVCRTLDASPVGVAAQTYIAKNPDGIEGTVKRLFEALTAFRPDGDGWPRSSKGFADSLRRVIPSLRMIGIHAHIEDKPRRDGYWCGLKKLPEPKKLPDRARTLFPAGKLQYNVHEVHQVHTKAESGTPRREDRELGELGELGFGVSPGKKNFVDGDETEDDV